MERMEELEAPDIFREVFEAYKAGKFRYLSLGQVREWLAPTTNEPEYFFGLNHQQYLAIHRGHCIEIHFIDFHQNEDDDDAWDDYFEGERAYAELELMDGDDLTYFTIAASVEPEIVHILQ